FDSSGGWPAPPAEIRRFVEAARGFAIDSRANDFFESHRALYDSVNGRIRPALERAVDLAWFAPYFGIPSDRMFVVVPLLVAAEGNYGQLRDFYRDQLRGSWFWTEELVNLYAQYEANRNAYPTFAAFMPRIIAYFDSLPDRVPAMQARYDELRPKIVSLSIASGSDS